MVAGVGLRLPPRSRTLAAHWTALTEGGVVRPAPEGREALGAGRSAAWLDDVDGVDLSGLSLDEGAARWLDPVGRLLLACARDALASAGLGKGPHAAGLWVGLGDDGWAATTWHAGHAGAPSAGLGAQAGFLATRVAYQLDLQGPAVALDAACASALAAVVAAADALRAGRVELALAGGATALVGATPDAWLRAIGALGTADRPRPFAKHGDGYVRGEGAGLVLLATEDAARRLGLPVIARLAGAGLSGGGRTQGIGAPSPSAHARAAAAALDEAGPGTVAYVELGGLGQPLADAIELDGVGRAYAGRGAALGTSRTVYGHLEHAAGVVGLATAIEALRRARLPPGAAPSDALPSPAGFRWASGDEVLAPDARVAVHASGMNGTVVHLVLAAGESSAALHPLPEERLDHPAPVVTDPAPAEVVPPIVRLGRILQDVFNLPDVPDADRPLAWQGLDSMGFVALRHRLEDEYGVALSQETVSGAATLRELLAAIEEPPPTVAWGVIGAAIGGVIVGVVVGMMMG